MIASEKVGVFAIVFAAAYAAVYAVAEQFNLALFTYHPAIGEIGFGAQRSREGPPMYWYGWMATSAIGAALAGVAATFLPDAHRRRIAPALAWSVPLVGMAAMCYFMAPFFTR